MAPIRGQTGGKVARIVASLSRHGQPGTLASCRPPDLSSQRDVSPRPVDRDSGFALKKNCHDGIASHRITRYVRCAVRSHSKGPAWRALIHVQINQLAEYTRVMHGLDEQRIHPWGWKTTTSIESMYGWFVHCSRYSKRNCHLRRVRCVTCTVDQFFSPCLADYLLNKPPLKSTMTQKLHMQCFWIVPSR